MKNNAGVLPGVFSCIFGVIGILSLGFIFIPLAAVTALISSILAVLNLSFRGIGVSLLAWTLTVIGLFTSPVLLGVIGIGLLSSPKNVDHISHSNSITDNDRKSASNFSSKQASIAEETNKVTNADLVNSSNLLTSIRTTQSSNLAKRIHFSEEEVRTLTRYIGKYTYEIINDPIFTEKMQLALGRDYQEFSNNLLVSAPIENEDGTIIGSGNRPHFGNELGAAFAINMESGYANIGLFDHKLGIILYEDSLQNSKHLHQWYLNYVKLIAEELFPKMTISALYINKNIVCGKINENTQFIFANNHFDSIKSDSLFPKTNKIIRQYCPLKAPS